MKQIEAALEEMSRLRGIEGCALVEIDSGMVWHSAGQMLRLEETAEVAVEFWRLYSRLNQGFSSFGELKLSTFSFSTHVMALKAFLRSDHPMCLVLIAHHGVNWSGWTQRLHQIENLLREKARLAATGPLKVLA